MVAANNLASLLSDHRNDKASLEKAQTLAASLRETQIPQFKDTLGWISYRRDDYVNAVSLLEKAVVALPDVPLVRYHLAMSYIAVGQTAKALEQLRVALSLDPNPRLKNNLPGGEVLSANLVFEEIAHPLTAAAGAVGAADPRVRQRAPSIA